MTSKKVVLTNEFGRFWSDSHWALDYPDAKLYAQAAGLVAAADVAERTVLKVSVVEDYGLETERVVKTFDPPLTKSMDGSDRLDVLIKTMKRAGGMYTELLNALTAYEKTGDHDHGKGPIGVGGPCPGGDCWVYWVRQTLEQLKPLDPNGKLPPFEVKR